MRLYACAWERVSVCVLASVCLVCSTSLLMQQFKTPGLWMTFLFLRTINEGEDDMPLFADIFLFSNIVQ